MQPSDEAKLVLNDIQAFLDERPESRTFHYLYNKIVSLLEVNDKEVAKMTTTSVPNVTRWRTGAVVPPGRFLILRILANEIRYKFKLKLA